MQENIHDEFVSALHKAMKEQLVVGSGFNKETTQGPLISQNSVNKVNKIQLPLLNFNLYLNILSR